MRTLLALLLTLCLATPALAQIELPPDREAKLIAQEKATKAKQNAAKAAAAATAAAAAAGPNFSLLDSYARRCLVGVNNLRIEAPQTAVPANCAELPGFDGQPRDLAGSRIKESSDGFTVSVAKKGGGGITVASKSGATLAQSIGGKQACFPGICTSQCCCDTSPAGRNTCCRFAQGKAAVCE